MRLLLILLAISSVLFSQYSDPPLSNVSDYNLDMADSLDGHYNASIAQNSTLTVADQIVSVSMSMDIAGVSLLVDNATYPYDDLHLIVARGHILGDLDGNCSYNSSAIYEVNATFAFANVSEIVFMESNVVEIPTGILDSMNSASGNDSMDISLDGEVHFIYHTDNCSGSSDNISVSIPVSINRSFTVCGKGKLFFLAAPALREQWFRNNRFNVAVLSQSPLYEAKIYEGKNITRNFTLRNFSIISNSYGLQEIISNKALPDGWIENSSFVVTPIPLEAADHSFAYAYLFGYNYSGLGEHELSLLVKDSFGGSEKYNETLTSVMLSYNGSTTETGSPIDSQPSRKSLPSTQESLVRLDISLGLVAMLLLLAFVNSWLLK
ncbi:MAG: hypothetical protein PHF60_01105 [Candidatus ainarchaeum sp.]|nr:hypothetical protein [Candidatus ainarchaeum sp.]